MVIAPALAQLVHVFKYSVESGELVFQICIALGRIELRESLAKPRKN